MLIDHPLIDADTTITPLTQSDVLQYFYYAALIYIKLERLHDAIDALETVSCRPDVSEDCFHTDHETFHTYSGLAMICTVHIESGRGNQCDPYGRL